MSSSVTIVIPTIPQRPAMLTRAVWSVTAQTVRPDVVIVEPDLHRTGAAATRDRALAKVDTEFVAFLDDDDELEERHIELLLGELHITGADMVYPWFTVVGGTDPFPQHFGKEWDNENPHQTTVTFLARTEMIRRCGGFTGNFVEDGQKDPEGHRAGEEYRLVLRMVEQGAKIVHLPYRTWRWHHHKNNTSGQANRV